MSNCVAPVWCSTPSLIMAKVGYCQRINHYPKIFVTASDRTVNIGVTYTEGDQDGWREIAFEMAPKRKAWSQRLTFQTTGDVLHGLLWQPWLRLSLWCLSQTVLFDLSPQSQYVTITVPRAMQLLFIPSIEMWVCLKMGYTPNYSHLVGIMIINHWV